MAVEIREAKSIYDPYPELSGDLLEEAIKQHLSWALGTLDTDARLFAQRMNDVIIDNTWKRVSPSWEDFCERFTGMTGIKVHEVVRGVEALGYEVPIPIEQARKAAVEQAKKDAILIKRGRPKKKGDNVTILSKNHKGNSKDYILRRLARENSDVLAAYERGEYRSVHAAAIAAGIVKDPLPMVDRIRKLLTRLSPMEKEQICAELIEDI